MEEASKIILAGLIILTLLLTLLQDKDTNCVFLQKELDKHTGNASDNPAFIRPTEDECKKWDLDKKAITVGGTLLNQSCAYNPARDAFGCELVFKGESKQGTLFTVTQNQTLPYELNAFYSFDLGNYCATRYSAALSGSYVIKDGESELKKIECKKD